MILPLVRVGRTMSGHAEEYKLSVGIVAGGLSLLDSLKECGANIRVGDTMLICQRKQNKWSTNHSCLLWYVRRG